MKINFYQTDDLIHKSLSSLLIKLLSEEKKALIYSQNPDILKQIDDGLWSFSKTKFIPHATIWDKLDNSRQLFLLTNIQENSNQADFLIMLDATDFNFLKQFTKSFYFFSPSNKEQARKLWADYKKLSAELDFYKKEADKWIANKL